MTVTDDEPDIAPDVGAADSRRPRRVGAPPPASSPGKVAETRHRNPTWLVAGVLLVVLSALGGVLLFTSSDDRTDVLVAAADLQPGRPVERGDLRIGRVAVGDDVASMPPADAADVVGRFPVGRVPAGTMLTPGMFAGEVPLGPDEIVFGAALDPGEAPLSGLEVGAPVELLEVAAGRPGRAGRRGGCRVARERHRLGGRADRHRPAVGVDARAPRRRSRASLASAADTLRVVLIGGAG